MEMCDGRAPFVLQVNGKNPSACDYAKKLRIKNSCENYGIKTATQDPGSYLFGEPGAPVAFFLDLGCWMRKDAAIGKRKKEN